MNFERKVIRYLHKNLDKLKKKKPNKIIEQNYQANKKMNKNKFK